MTNYTFDANAQGWGTAQMSWTNTDGSPGSGCLFATGVNSASTDISGLSIVVSNGSPMSLRYKIIWNGGDVGPVDINMTTGYEGLSGGVITSDPYNSGWIYLSGSFTTAGTVTDLSVTFGAGSDGIIFNCYLDSIYIAESPGVAGNNQKYLGIDWDSHYLYLTQIIDDTAQLAYYDLGTRIAAGTSSFGTMSMDDWRTTLKGVWPAVVPGADDNVFVYGDDGNNNFIQVNDLSGTLGWIQVAGTSDFGSNGFVVDLLENPLSATDLKAALIGGSIAAATIPYGAGVSRYGSADWEFNGSVGGTIYEATRDPVQRRNILAARSNGGTVRQSFNLGVSFSTAGTANTGGIRKIEASRSDSDL